MQKETIIGKLFRILRNEGVGGAVYKARRKLKLGREFRGISYRRWMKRVEKKNYTIPPKKLGNAAPLISVVVPLYSTPKKYLDELVASVQAQTYPKWELCFANATPDDSLDRHLKHLMARDARIRVKKLPENYGISGNTNAAIDMARGRLVAFMDHDDILAKDAFAEVVKAYDENRTRELIYTDHDMLTNDGRRRYEPCFKPDFSIDYLLSNNYICHLVVVTMQLLNRVGKLNSSYDGAQDYDFLLRCSLYATNIYHIPQILYHWRASRASVAGGADAKGYAYEAGKRAIEEHLRQKGYMGESPQGLSAAVEYTDIPGNYRVNYHIRGDEPLISIMIPNKDHAADLDVCIRSIRQQDYKNIEIIIIENNSEDKATSDYYRRLKEEKDIRIVRFKGDFNFSAINNYGRRYARGSFLLLLNNDIRLKNCDMLSKMAALGLRDDVGIVGARLFYDDDTIQHAGIVLGYGGVGGHAFLEAPECESGYMNRIVSRQDLSAVTAACLLVKGSVYDAVGGMNEELAVAFNDVDFCLRVRAKRLLVVYEPDACAYHYESKSRGYENTPEKKARFEDEIRTFKRTWRKELAALDPYYNPNLNLEDSLPTYTLAKKIYTTDRQYRPWHVS